MSLAIGERLAALDWARIGKQLWGQGHARTGPLLSATECAALRGMFADDARFRKRINMERYRYGTGDYAYFAAPLPDPVAALRTHLYARLAPIANDWVAALGEETRGAGGYPRTLEAYLARCHAAGQQRPTPLLLRYTEGGHNRLHQDRYGALGFPFQTVILLSTPGVESALGGAEKGGAEKGGAEENFEGGAFLLVENRPREQSRGEAITPVQGEAVIFPNARRPIAGKRGWRTAQVRHGVATVTRGERLTLGIIFHDAE